MSERGQFTETQRDILLQPIADWRIHELDGNSHVAGWDAIAHLNRLFGFEGWDKEIVDLSIVYEHVGTREVAEYEQGRKTGRTKTVPACSVGYRCTLRLTVRDTEGNVIRVIEDAAMGTSKNQRDMGDAHDLALKSAVTYALKRCAKDLGDQFGLSLYNKGQRSGVVGQVAVYGGKVEEHTGTVEADGIHEGDDSFGDKRGEGDTALAVAPEQTHEAVREPAPAQPKDDKPEPEVPAERPEAPVLDKAKGEEWVKQITAATTVNGEAGEGEPQTVRQIWKAIDAERHLDSLVLDLKSESQMALRELMVRRVNEIETEGAA